MKCTTVKLGGFAAIVCGQARRLEQHCACGNTATWLCDEPIGRGTCDKLLCAKCGIEIGPDKHLCKAHHTSREQRREQLLRDPAHVRRGYWRTQVASSCMSAIRTLNLVKGLAPNDNDLRHLPPALLEHVRPVCQHLVDEACGREEAGGKRHVIERHVDDELLGFLRRSKPTAAAGENGELFNTPTGTTA